MIKIDYKVYNVLTQALIDQVEREKRIGYDAASYPWLFLVASKKENGVINLIHQVKHNEIKDYLEEQPHAYKHCHRMSNLHGRTFSKEAIKIMEKGYIVRGLARVGRVFRPGIGGNVGPVESELQRMGKGVLFVTVEPGGIMIKQDGVTVEHAVITEKK